MIHTFSVLPLQLKKLRWHNKSAIDLSNANNPACGYKEVPRSTGHIVATTRYSDQQGSKSRKKNMRLCKQWFRPLSERINKPSYSISRAASIDSDCCRPPTTSSQQQSGQITLQLVLINEPKFLKATNGTKIRKNEIPRSMVVVEALSWVKPAREPASSRPKPCASLKKPHESFPFAAPCGPRRKKNDRGQTSAFPQRPPG